MSNYFSPEVMERSLLIIANDIIDDDVYFYKDEYYKLNFSLWDTDSIKFVLDSFGFKDIGNALDYPGVFPEQDTFDNASVFVPIEKTNRIVLSKKYNAIMCYTINRYNVSIFCIINKDKYSKFNTKLSEIIEKNKHAGIFNNVNFKCKKKEFIEISDVLNDEDKYVTVQKKKVNDEKLVFDKDSEIFNVMEDIKIFFEKDTKKLYKDMGILYKRGIILYGDPGNGKTAMIREIIRQLHKITVIIINPNTPRITFVLSELIDTLKEKHAIIVIEDIDSVINRANRSELLNILDGVNMKSGVYFIGTTNYPEKIDPAFVNRSGRFDRLYKIPNPNENIRKAFFRSCRVSDTLSKFKIHKSNSENSNLNIVDLFVKYSDNMSMANLKELMIATQYMLIRDKNISVEEAIEKCHEILINTRTEHVESHMSYRNRYIE